MGGISGKGEYWVNYAAARDHHNSSSWGPGGKLQLAKEPEQPVSVAVGVGYWKWVDALGIYDASVRGDIGYWNGYLVATQDLTSRPGRPAHPVRRGNQMTTRRDFLRAGLATGLAAATISLPALPGLAQEPAAPEYQHPKDPDHLTALEMSHWPKLGTVGVVAAGKPFQLAIQIGQHIHPMTAEHHIEWVEVWAGDTRVQHTGFDEPTWVQPVLTVALVRTAPALLKVRLHCNLHGLWENSVQV